MILCFFGLSVILIMVALIGYSVDNLDPLMWLLIPESMGVLFLLILTPILYFEYKNMRRSIKTEERIENSTAILSR